MGEFKSANEGPLYTRGLATCVRIAVTGSYKSHSEGADRFLAHISEQTDATGYIGVQGLINTIKCAQRNNLEIDKIVVVVGDFALNDGHDETKKADRLNDKEQEAFSRKVLGDIKSGIDPKNNVKVNVADHAIDDPYMLRITEDKKILLKVEPNGGWETFEEWEAANQDDEDDEDEE
jgi:hypothetical protein